MNQNERVVGKIDNLDHKSVQIAFYRNDTKIIEKLVIHGSDLFHIRISERSNTFFEGIPH